MKIILNTIAVSLLLMLVGASGSVAWAAKSKNPATNYPSLVGASEIKGTHVKNPIYKTRTSDKLMKC